MSLDINESSLDAFLWEALSPVLNNIMHGGDIFLNLVSRDMEFHIYFLFSVTLLMIRLGVSIKVLEAFCTKLYDEMVLYSTNLYYV